MSPLSCQIINNINRYIARFFFQFFLEAPKSTRYNSNVMSLYAERFSLNPPSVNKVVFLFWLASGLSDLKLHWNTNFVFQCNAISNRLFSTIFPWKNCKIFSYLLSLQSLLIAIILTITSSYCLHTFRIGSLLLISNVCTFTNKSINNPIWIGVRANSHWSNSNFVSIDIWYCEVLNGGAALFANFLILRHTIKRTFQCWTYT